MGMKEMGAKEMGMQKRLMWSRSQQNLLEWVVT